VASAQPWDQKLANAAAVADQCAKLGGVVLQPPKKPTGFAEPPRPR
jgi:hypothetical protein